MTGPTQHIATQHLAVADAITAVASAGAIWGYFTNYLTPAVSFLVLCAALTWYCFQISGHASVRAWLHKRHMRKLARHRRRLRKRAHRKHHSLRFQWPR